MSALTGGGAPAETAAPETLRAEGLQEDSTEAVVRGERRRLLTLMSITGLAALLIGLIVELKTMYCRKPGSLRIYRDSMKMRTAR